MAKVSRGSEQAMIRLPDGMRDRLKDEAVKNGRSMNAEIVARLEGSFDVEPSQPDFVEAHRIIENLLLSLDAVRNGNDAQFIESSERDGFLFLSGVPTKWISELRLWEMATHRINWSSIDEYRKTGTFKEYVEQNQYNAIKDILKHFERLGYSIDQPGDDQ